jgi:hypothetical protein
VIALLDDVPDIPVNDLIMSKNMADTLHKHYPEHRWAVCVEGANGIAKVYHLDTSGSKAYILDLASIYSSSSFDRDLIKAGGEILERHRLARGRFNLDRWENLPTDFAGRFLVDMG